MNTRQHMDLLRECLVTLRHARVFIASREKMHSTGIELYDQLTRDVEAALKSPGPELPRVVCQCSNPSCGQIWEADPRSHCPGCKDPDGGGWSCISVVPRRLPKGSEDAT